MHALPVDVDRLRHRLANLSRARRENRTGRDRAGNACGDAPEYWAADEGAQRIVVVAAAPAVAGRSVAGRTTASRPAAGTTASSGAATASSVAAAITAAMTAAFAA